jgi:hypothetical protein
MGNAGIPSYQGQPILDDTPRQAFRINPEEIIDSIKQQFKHRSLCFRELGQNSVDSGCSVIDADFRFDEEHGSMQAIFRDDGCGMTLETIKRHYLCLFDSSKEDIINAIGEFSLGRLSMFCYDPALLELITLPPQGPGYAVIIESNLSGAVYEISRREAVSLLDGQHGTLICMTVPLSDRSAFVSEMKVINDTIRNELCWINPVMHQTTVVLGENDHLEYGRERVNTLFTVPGEYTLQDREGKTYFTIKLASGLGEADFSVGLANPETKKLSPVTLSIGKIPVERFDELPWTGGTPFGFRETHILLDSFFFKTNIGRNRIRLDTPFVRELLPKIFNHLILDGFIRSTAILLKKRPVETYHFRKPFQILMADVLIQSDRHGFAVPDDVLTAPFIQSYMSNKLYSISHLDQWKKPFYFTWERPSIKTMHHLLTADEPDFICVCLADLPLDFQKYLENRYKNRLKKKETRILVKNANTPESLEMAARVEKKIGLKKFWPEFYQSLRNIHGLPCRLSLRIGRFFSYADVEEKATPTCFQKDPSPVIYLNSNNPHIQNLLELLVNHGEYEPFAAHFIMREIFCDEALACTATHREQMLTRDLIYRFNLYRRAELSDMEDLLFEEPDSNEFKRFMENIIHL